MRLCQEHWNQALDGVPSNRLLLANTLFMQYLLDYLAENGIDPYKYQAELGDECPACEEGSAGQVIWDRAREEAGK